MLTIENILRSRISGLSQLHSKHLSTRAADGIYYNDKYENGESRFQKVLVANRGEIACRVMRTCQRLGIKTVVVFSEADIQSPFVRMADEAVCIGPPPSVHSYLNANAILEAVKATGAEAVHPGYGFLSENYTFAKQLTSMGITFVGPNPEVIRVMGDKIESKHTASKAGINCIPGFEGEINNPEEALRIAKDIGFPVMMKASAGGGGKGTRLVRNSAEFREALRLSREEAESSFGDGRILLERWIEDARHIEVQVLCDTHGTVLHLHERDCSIQRRNQKLVEEAPSPFLASSSSLRQRLYDQAVALARAVGYDSAGTVEFLLDCRNQELYFLEMNTRLQVEHPVTECITGVDVVHQMLRIAKGHKLLYRQEDIPTGGWAVECRICAEDPCKALGQPSTGQLTSYREPTHIPGVRCDSGVAEGSVISVFYDPLMCKLIAFGDDRKTALNVMAKALDSFVIRGVANNIPLLRDIIVETGFISGTFTTNHLERIYSEGFTSAKLSDRDICRLVAVGAVVHVKAAIRNYAESGKSINTPFNLVVNIGKGGVAVNTRVVRQSGLFEVTLVLPNASATRQESVVRVTDNFTLADNIIEQEFDEDGAKIFQLRGRSPVGDVCLQYRGSPFWLRIRSEKAAALEAAFIEPNRRKNKPQVRSSGLLAPLPGLVTSVLVEVGQTVEAGEALCVLEAMKMRNYLNAGTSGVIKSVNVKPGQIVAEGETLLELEQKDP